jgi:hypothetical protein
MIVYIVIGVAVTIAVIIITWVRIRNRIPKDAGFPEVRRREGK